MNIYIDENNLLCLTLTGEQGKTYTHIFDGYTVNSMDKTICVIHKKTIKAMQFKDIGKNMAVIYSITRKTPLRSEPIQLHQNGARQALMLYKAYDEEQDKNYGFLYKYPENNRHILNTQLHLLGIQAHIQSTEKGLIVSENQEHKESTQTNNDIQSIISYLFVLTLLYGKMTIKNDALIGIKIHIPLFGGYIKEQQVFDALIYLLQTKGIFVQKSTIENSNGIIYQISSHDYELLIAFAQLYKNIAKIDKIPIHDSTIQYKQDIIGWIQGQNIQANKDTMQQIQHSTIKILTK